MTNLQSCSALFRFMYCLTVWVTKGPAEMEINTFINELFGSLFRELSRDEENKHSLQLSGMTFSARGKRSSNEASRTRARISGYDITAQLAKIEQDIKDCSKTNELFFV